MKLAPSLALLLLPLAGAALNGVPSNGWFGGRGGLALVVKNSSKGGSTYATRDGGEGSASFYGEAPKGGSFFRDAADCARDTAKDVEDRFKKKEVVSSVKGGSNGVDETLDPGSFWESKLFKEGGLGFLFGAGTGVCVRKVNKGAAVAVGGACVAAQYISRSDFLGCGGKLGWPKLDDGMLAEEDDHDNFPCLWRAGRLFKETVTNSLPTVEGYVIGLAAGLKGPLP